MARTMIGATNIDLQDDSGAVLWSFVQGEQLEFPVTLNFIENVSLGYVYEAVIIEGENVEDAVTPPLYSKEGGIQTKLVVRVPLYRGEWSELTTYHKGDVITYGNIVYKLPILLSYQSATPPSNDPNWEETTNNVIYIQFPKGLSINPAWEIQPNTASKIYGFFELRVTENSGAPFQQTWKPMRGLVELQYSPTEVVPDL
jgi:hypothetical protein